MEGTRHLHEGAVQQMPYGLQTGKWPRTISHTDSHGKNLFAAQHTRVEHMQAQCIRLPPGAGDQTGHQPDF
jgi:hypothetical protein